MTTIYKYDLKVTNYQNIKIKGLKRVLSVFNQHDILVLYALVDPESQEDTDIIVVLIGTGNKIESPVATRIGAGVLSFLGTVSQYDSKLMWHIFWCFGKEY